MNELEQVKIWGVERKTFCMLMHLSQFAGALIPGLGLVLPILMWSLNKDKFPEVDEHGKMIVNWMISATIYLLISVVLTLIFVGFFSFVAVSICCIVFAILGAVKANEGKVYNYPMTIRFFK